MRTKEGPGECSGWDGKEDAGVLSQCEDCSMRPPGCHGDSMQAQIIRTHCEAKLHSHLGTDAGRDGLKTPSNSFLYSTLPTSVFMQSPGRVTFTELARSSNSLFTWIS